MIKLPAANSKHGPPARPMSFVACLLLGALLQGVSWACPAACFSHTGLYGTLNIALSQIGMACLQAQLLP